MFLLRGNSGDVRRSLAVGLRRKTHACEHGYLYTAIFSLKKTVGVVKIHSSSVKMKVKLFLMVEMLLEIKKIGGM